MRHSLLINTLCCWITLFCINSVHAVATDIMTIKYTNRGALDARNAYIFELIKTILEETKPEFGDYRIEPYAQDQGSKRLAVLIKDGVLINVAWGSPGTVLDSTDVIPIQADIYRGLLGYRICLTNTQRNLALDNILNIDHLKPWRLGQRQTWDDLEIYAFNNINTVTAPTFEGLLAMLTLNRFDCLPLGANEVEFVYRNNIKQMPTLAIEKNLLIRYDYPYYFHISAKHPKIAARFKEGMKKIQISGAFNQIFNRYFREDINTLHLENRRVICLKSPFLPLENQCLHPNDLGVLDTL